MNIKYESYLKEVTTNYGHVRKEFRTLYLMKYLPFWLHFPTTKQASIIDRTRLIMKSGKVTREFVDGITSLENVETKTVLNLNRGL